MSACVRAAVPLRSLLVLCAAVCALDLTGAGVAAYASGVLVPEGADAQADRLETESVRVDAEVRGPLATLRISQIVRNASTKPLRAEYFFAVPAGTMISKLRLHDGGQALAGTLLTRDRARAHMLGVLRRRKDPALVGLLGAQIFHVPGLVLSAGAKKTLVLTYNQTLGRDAGLTELVVPLCAPRAPIPLLTVGIDIQAVAALGPVYSPTHDVQVILRGGQRAWVAYEGEQPTGGKDLTLFWSTTRSPVGATLLTHWPQAEPQGYFLMLAVPRSTVGSKKETRSKNVSFVVDVSGSMRGEKLEGVRAALRRVIAGLAVGDRFNVVAYNSEVSALWSRPKAVSPDSIKQALYFVQQLKAARGTNIEGALRAALGTRRSDAIPSVILFLTDGRPTVGETDAEALLATMRKANPGQRARIYVLGVGVGVNPVLLDRLALENGGVPVYVRRGESVEDAVAALYARIQDPVLTDVAFTAPDMRITDVLPAELPDLFGGSEIVVAGRYAAGGPVEIVLAGRNGISEREFHFTRTAARRGEGLTDDFPARVWATRRIAECIDAIRLHPASKADHAEEITTLSARFGVLTEYTAYLADEQKVSHRALLVNTERTRRNIAALSRRTLGGAGLAQAKAQAERRTLNRLAPTASTWFPTPDDRDVRHVHLRGVRQMANRTFYFRGGYHGWVDVLADVAKPPEAVVVRWSPAFFKLLETTSRAENMRLAQAGPLLLEVQGRMLRIVDPA